MVPWRRCVAGWNRIWLSCLHDANCVGSEKNTLFEWRLGRFAQFFFLQPMWLTHDLSCDMLPPCGLEWYRFIVRLELFIYVKVDDGTYTNAEALNNMWLSPMKTVLNCDSGHRCPLMFHSGTHWGVTLTVCYIKRWKCVCVCQQEIIVLRLATVDAAAGWRLLLRYNTLGLLWTRLPWFSTEISLC